MKNRRRLLWVYALSMLGSGMGFITQILVSGFWSTAFSQDVTFYSLNLAFYFLSLGIGTRWSRNLSDKPRVLFALVAALCLWCGLCISLLRLVIFQLNEATPLAILIVCVAGALAGCVLPLALRLFPEKSGASLGTLFFVDYLAAIVFSLVFTFGLLLPWGYTGSAVALSLGGLVVLAGTTAWALGQARWVAFALLLALLPWPLARGVRYWVHVPEKPGAPKVLVSQQSHYQKIIVTEFQDDQGHTQNALYLDGFPQFMSGAEQLYHFCLVNLPIAAEQSLGRAVRHVLVLGGGDGLVARNLLAFSSIEQIEMVELDPAMVELARTHPALTRHNENALQNPKVQVHLQDAFSWVRAQKQTYDLILIDLPSPKNLALARLFSVEFYRNVFALLRPDGFVAIQAGPYYAPPPARGISTITAGVQRAVEAAGLKSSIYLTSRDADAFVLGTRAEGFSMDSFSLNYGIQKDGRLSGVCQYDPTAVRPQVATNTLNTLPLATDAMRWYRQVHGMGFFFYRDFHGIFLPD
ncbi:fused MFS/spermidine synthase [bacterium]|nr:fused MFS/spermidine synthase [bacterium]